MKRVLIVDDDSHALSLLEILLQQQGYEVLTARNGLEALELLQTQPVDLILSDVAMPQVNGYQLFQCIKASPDPRSVSIPFIFISGRATLDSDVRFAKSLGVDDYLLKPVCNEDLLAIVKGKILAAERLQQALSPSSSWPEEMEQITLTINQRRLRLDYRQHRAWSDDAEIHLTAREMFLLERLAYQPNQVVDTMQLFGSTHGRQVADRHEAGRLLRPIIQTLRSKLKGQIGPCIKNVRGRGYMLTDVQVGDRPPHKGHPVSPHTPHTNPVNTL